MAIITTHRALFYNEKGEYAGFKGIRKKDRSKKTFEFMNGAYFFEPHKSSSREVTVLPFFWNRIYYEYPTWNSYPYHLKKDYEPRIEPTLYNTIMKSRVAEQLNKIGKGFTLETKHLLIGVAIIGVLWYLGTGHKITP